MNTSRFFVNCLAGIALALATGFTYAADNDAGEPTEGELIAVLQSDAPGAEKAITCKKLAIYGTGEAVPALAPLLADERLSSWARIALEVISDPAADAALREAAGNLSGRQLIGAINSIGVRRDPLAIETLSQRLADADADVASAAAVALGRIGGPEATRILEPALADAPESVRSAVAEGCVLCAEKFWAEGQADEAVRLYDRIRQADVPKQRIVEGTRGAILARQSDGIPLLIEQLESTDEDLYAIGLTTARELDGLDVTEALVGLLGKTAPDRQAPLLLVLADRGDAEALPAVLQAAWSGPNAVRIPAIGVLQRLGNVSSIPTLLDVALEADAEVAEAAKTALEGLGGEDVDDDLVARLSQAEGKMRQLVIELIGKRRIDAIPALLKATEDSDPAIRSAALTALGSTVGLENLSVLITRVVSPQTVDKEVAKSALRAACIRMPDRDACAEKLTAAMRQAPESVKTTMLEILGAMQGAKALEAVGAAAKGSDPEMQDAASRLLGEWMTVDAAPVLLEVANDDSARFQTRALRGYIRLARQFSADDAERVAMCRKALEAAKRDEEKKLVLEVLERTRTIESLRLAVEMSKTPSLKSDATRTSQAIARRIRGGSAEVQALLKQLGEP